MSVRTDDRRGHGVKAIRINHRLGDARHRQGGRYRRLKPGRNTLGSLAIAGTIFLFGCSSTEDAGGGGWTAFTDALMAAAGGFAFGHALETGSTTVFDTYMSQGLAPYLTARSMDGTGSESGYDGLSDYGAAGHGAGFGVPLAPAGIPGYDPSALGAAKGGHGAAPGSGSGSAGGDPAAGGDCAAKESALYRRIEAMNSELASDNMGMCLLGKRGKELYQEAAALMRACPILDPTGAQTAEYQRAAIEAQQLADAVCVY